MKSRWKPLMAGACHVIGLALLALSATAGGSAVRAAGEPAAPESAAVKSLVKMVSALEQRVAAFEASVAAFGNSFAAKRIAAQELCVAGSGGSQTCIDKAQRDALPKGTMRTAQAAPAAQPDPRASEQDACPEKCVAPDAVVASPAPSEKDAANAPANSEEPAPAAPAGAGLTVREPEAVPDEASAETNQHR